MKKHLISIAVVLFMGLPVLAQETSSPDTNWDGLLNDFEKPQINKPVSEAQFNEAINTVKKLKERNKKKIKPDKNKAVEYSTGAESNPMEATISENSLLRLPYDIYSNQSVLSKGFYLVEPSFKNNLHYLKFKQGQDTVAVVQMEKTDDLLCVDDLNCLKMELVGSDYLKLIFKELDITLVKYFYIAQ